MCIREIEDQDLKVWNLKEKRKINEGNIKDVHQQRIKEIHKQIKFFFIYLQAEQQQRSINYYTEQK